MSWKIWVIMLKILNSKNMIRTPKAKRNLLRRLIEIEILLGYDVTDFVGHQLSYFNWESVEMLFEKRRLEYKQNEGLEYER